MKNKEKKYDYSNKKPFNDVPCKEDEVLAPFMVSKDLSDMTYVNKQNLETWRIGGKKILVGFVAVHKDKLKGMMSMLWDEVNDYMEKFDKKRCFIFDKKGRLQQCPENQDCSSCPWKDKEYMFTSLSVSLDNMMDGLDNEDTGGYDPTGTTKDQDSQMLHMMISDLIAEVGKKNKKYGDILQLLYKEHDKGEILKELSLGKSQGYEDIKRAQAMAKELFYK